MAVLAFRVGPAPILWAPRPSDGRKINPAWRVGTQPAVLSLIDAREIASRAAAEESGKWARECKECGSEFRTDDRFQKCCDDACYRAYNGLSPADIDGDDGVDDDTSEVAVIYRPKSEWMSPKMYGSQGRHVLEPDDVESAVGSAADDGYDTLYVYR